MTLTARLVVGALAVALAGCSTKADIRDVREDLNRLEARQDSIYDLLQTQNRQILASLSGNAEQLLDVRGDVIGQLTELQDQLVQVSELTGQIQIRLNQLDQEMTAAGIRDATRAPPGGGETGAGAAGAGGEAAREFYEAGLEQLGRGNAATARRAFEMVVDSFAGHPVAAESQRQIGETHAMDGQYDDALRAFERVVERYPDSESAPRALYRAGVIAQERGQTERAREYFRRVISAYPQSDARSLAEDALERIR